MDIDIYGTNTPRILEKEEDAQKMAIYEAMSTRGRRYVDRIGYERWDPFEAPKDPLDIRTDVTKRTTQQLVRDFLHENPNPIMGNDYSKGVLECALGIVNKDDKFKGIFEFCLWYEKLLKKEKNK